MYCVWEQPGHGEATGKKKRRRGEGIGESKGVEKKEGELWKEEDKDEGERQQEEGKGVMNFY
jgi:hypothetical protein